MTGERARTPPPEPYRVTVTLEDIAYEGGALAHCDGKAVFADYGIPGEEAVIEVDRERKGVAMGRVVEGLSPAADRVEPQVPYFGVCGGRPEHYHPPPRQPRVDAD